MPAIFGQFAEEDRQRLQLGGQPSIAWREALQAKRAGKRFLLEIGNEPSSLAALSISTRSSLSPDKQSQFSDASPSATCLSHPHPSISLADTGTTRSTTENGSSQPKISNWAALFKSSTPNSSENVGNNLQKPFTNAWPRNYSNLSDIVRNYQPSFESRIIVPRGFINRGNMCFMNAILQPLIFCAPFYNLLYTIAKVVPHNFSDKSITPLMDALLRFMQEFKETSLDETEIIFDSPILPEYIFDAMGKNEKFKYLLKGRQEDAEEYLGFLLDDLHEELISDFASAGRKELSADQWIEVGPKNKGAITTSIETKSSPITRIFGGQLRSTIKSPGSKDSAVIEPFMTLQLDITSHDIINIEDAIRHLVKQEILDGYISPTQEQGDATKQVLFEQLPNVLILHLKRFTYVDGQIQKVTKHISYGFRLKFTPELLAHSLRTKGSVSYSLIAVVFHHGKKAADGHYTCELKRADGRWLHFDDSVVSEVTGSEVTSARYPDRSEYLLFYQRDI